MKQKFTIGSIWRVGYPPLIYYGIVNIVQILAIFVMTFYAMTSYEEAIKQMSEQKLNEFILSSFNEVALPAMIIYAAATIPVLIAFMYHDMINDKIKGIYVKYKGIRVNQYLWILPLGITAMLAGNFFVSFISSYFPSSWIEQYKQVEDVLYSDSLGVQILAVAVMAPILEELIYRGLVYNRLKHFVDWKVALVISSLIFGILHLNVTQGIYAFIIGSICVFLYEKYKSIVAPIIMHMTANLIAVLVTYANSFVDSSQKVKQTETIGAQMELLPAIVIFGFFTIMLLHAIKRNVKTEIDVTI